MPRKKTTIIPITRIPGYHFNAETARERNTIGRKIAVLRKQHRLTQQGLADLLSAYGCDIQKTAVTKWEIGATTPSAYQIIAICFALNVPDLIAEFTGLTPSLTPELNEKGLKLVDDYRNLLIQSGKYTPRNPNPQTNIASTIVPTSYIRPAAGSGNFLDEESFEDREYPESAVPDGTDFALFVDGDSMSPIYINNQVVFVQECDSVSPGEVGIFSVDNEVVIKIFDLQEPDASVIDEFTDSDGAIRPQVVLRSYNPDWKPRPISPFQEFHVFGRVLN